MTRTDFRRAIIPIALRQRDNWVGWRLEIRRDKWGQLVQTKVPLDPRTGAHASVTDPAAWTPFDVAVDAACRHGWGVGFVFCADAPFTGIDLDKCREPRTGTIAAWAHGVLRMVRSYSEVSPSGTGVKIFIAAKLKNRAGRRKGPVEIYSAKRFFTVTGDALPSSCPSVQPRQTELDALEARLFPPESQPLLRRRFVAAAIADDAALIERAMRARNGAKFSRLWRGDWSEYSSQSEADAALCAILAHWTQYDAVRVDALFRQSGLCREKWTRREDYRRRTIERVLS